MMIFSLVAMTGLEKCCITSAYRSGYVTQVSDPWSVGLLFITVMNWILCFRFDALTELGAFMRTEFLCYSVLRVTVGSRVKLAGRKSALTSPNSHDLQKVYSTDR